MLSASAIWHSAVKSAKRLVGLLSRATPLIVGSSSVSWVKAAFHFAKFVRVTIIHQGHRGLAIYLKTANVMLMRSIAGDICEDTRSIGGAVARTRRGLPRVIPAGYRKRIRNGDLSVIRLYLGFFTLYRVLNFRGKLNLSTITKPGAVLTGPFLDEWKAFAKVFFIWLRKFGVKPYRKDLVPVAHGSREAQVSTETHPNPMGIKRPSQSTAVDDGMPPYRCRLEIWGYVPTFFPLMKSGPNSSKGAPNSSNIIWDFLAWVNRPVLFRSFQVLVAVTRSWVLLPPVIGATLEYLRAHHSVLRIPHSGWLGRLSVKEEPGKLRVFAMVDSLTQWLLYPLHRFIFDRILKKIPQDGTFDQIGPVRRLIAAKQAGRDHRLWSFDLSAATDRIPVVLQEILLGEVATPEYALHWRLLLTDRDYKAPDQLHKQSGWGAGGSAKSLRYAVGQPMGAYSSWAMLALVHHMMVQYAAWKVGSRSWFEQYAVLGDDLVIGDHLVASEYQKLCQVIGVEIGLSKSIISDNLSLEFAKRFFFKGQEVTPVPLLGLAVGWLGVREIPEIVKEVRDRTGHTLSMYLVGRFLNLGYRVCSGLVSKPFLTLSRKARSIALLLTRPGAVYGVKTLLDWYSLSRVSGSKLSVEGAFPAIADSVRQRVDHFLSLRLRARLNKALLSFDLTRHMKKVVSDRMAWFGVAEWWHENVILPYRAPMLKALDRIDEEIARLDQNIEKKDESALLTLLHMMEDLEEQVSLVPTAVRLERAEPETAGRRSDRFPRRVRGWHRLFKKFRRANQTARHNMANEV